MYYLAKPFTALHFVKSIAEHYVAFISLNTFHELSSDERNSSAVEIPRQEKIFCMRKNPNPASNAGGEVRTLPLCYAAPQYRGT